MRKKIMTVALLVAALGLATTSCQKETIYDNYGYVNDANNIRSVSYSINGVAHNTTLIGDDAWADFIDRMLTLAEEGYRVSFRYEVANSNAYASKEKVTFTTSKRDEAYAWADNMAEQGYDVTIIYDKKTGIYTCTAIK